MTTLKPTAEQAEAISLFLTGSPLVIEAGAGTGKTSTLELIARATQQTGTYVAFNKAIVQEAAQRFPMSVQSSTAHSLAWRAVGKRYADRLPTRRTASARLGQWLDLGPLQVRRADGSSKVLQPGYLASLVLRGIRAFCNSADEQPTGYHLPYVHGLDMPDSTGHRTHENNDLLRDELAPSLLDAWRDLSDPTGRLPFTHDHYLKVWQLGTPTIPGDFVLFDEAQDASPVMLAAVAAQIDRGAQLVFVGDTQQQIYEWRGAVNALARLDGERTYLTQSWRFGQAIADVANVLLEELDAELRLSGNPQLSSRLGADAPRAVLCRSNVGAIDTVLRLQRAGRKVHLVGGGEEVVRFAKAVVQLQETGSSSHPDLACFDSWREVQQYVAEDPQGSDLALMVKLIDEYGLRIILDALDGMIAEAAADVIVSTAHKAKGREWDNVRLYGDFHEPDQLGGGRDGELRLLYVAATRARAVLDIRQCGPLLGLLDGRA